MYMTVVCSGTKVPGETKREETVCAVSFFVPVNCFPDVDCCEMKQVFGSVTP